MSFKLLFVDDQPDVLATLISQLEATGLHCTILADVNRALEAYDDEHFDVVLLDVRLQPQPQGEDDDDDDGGNRKGLEIYESIRQRDLRKIPIIMLTAFDQRGWMVDWTKNKRSTDSRLWVVPKGVLAADLRKIVVDAITSGPYYAREVSSNASAEIYCERSNAPDASVLGSHWPAHNTSFRDNFIEHIQNDVNREHTYKLIKNHGQDRKFHGMLYTAGNHSPENFPDYVLFESAPWNKRGASDRELRRIGMICVARLIRESQARQMRGEFSIDVGLAGPFFERLGFKRLAQGVRLYVLDHDDAMTILETVTRW